MKSQVITPRVSNRGALATGRSSGPLQRPSPRNRGASTWSQRSRLGVAMAMAFQSAKIVAAVGVVLLIIVAYRGAASASFFQVRSLDVAGAAPSSSDEIRSAVQESVAKTGVWRADLPSLSAEITNRVPMVRSAVVSRVLPDGLRVRITERVPRAVLQTSEGRMIWVDEDGVQLRPMSPSDSPTSFFIRGLDQSRTESGRAANRERMKKYLDVARDWDAVGISARISEINLSDLSDIRVQLSGADSQIEVRLGGDDTSNRLSRALKVLDAQRDTLCRPFIRYIVATRINTTIGLPAGMQPCAGNAAVKYTDQPESANPARESSGKVKKASSGAKLGARDKNPAMAGAGRTNDDD